MNLIHKVTKRISPYMKSRGFGLSGKNYYYISNDIAYCLALDAPGGLLYATAYIMPLYVPCESRYYTYGSRLNELWGIRLPLLQKDDHANMIDGWCDALCQCIEEVIIPFYKQIETPNKLAEYVEHKANRLSGRFVCPNVFIERLMVYTYLYLRNYGRTILALNNYQNLLVNSTFLTDTVRQSYIDEIDTVRSLLEGNELGISSFCSKISDSTRKILM